MKLCRRVTRRGQRITQLNVGLCAWDYATMDRTRFMRWMLFLSAAWNVVQQMGIPHDKSAIDVVVTKVTYPWVAVEHFTAQLMRDVLDVVRNGESPHYC